MSKQQDNPVSPEKTQKAQPSRYVVASGKAFAHADASLRAGDSIDASVFKSTRDASGQKEFERQIEKGNIVKAGRKQKDDTASDGVIVPSGAQIIEGESGDASAKKALDAMLSGDEDEFAKLNGAKSGKEEDKK